MSIPLDERWYANSDARTWEPPVNPARAFHAGLPGYTPTPLVDAPPLATLLGVKHVLVKDESARFDLGAFKFLGASWAVFRALSAASGFDGPANLAALRAHVATEPAYMLVSATDGNHGRAVARTARLLGLPAAIFMPDGVHDAVVERVRGEGATVTMVNANYDGAVATARRFADGDPHRLLIQDTAWDGYTDVPNWIAEGYLTLTDEIDEQVAALGLGGVDVVSVPIGVGALAQTIVERYRTCRSSTHQSLREPDNSDSSQLNRVYRTCRSSTHQSLREPDNSDSSQLNRVHRTNQSSTRVLGVEPDTAACVLISLRAGHLTTVPTAHTIANGLNCGTPSATAWPWMRDGLSAAITVSDDDLRLAMARLADVGVQSGPSGCASFAGLVAALTDAGHRADLGVDGGSVVLALSTEGPIPGVS